MNKSGYTQDGLPFSGASPQSRHHSAEGAKAASPGRIVKTERYLELLADAGLDGLSDHEAKDRLQVPMSSINSIRAGCWPQIVPAYRRVASPYARPERPLWNTCWRLATEDEQDRLRADKAAADDIPF